MPSAKLPNWIPSPGGTLTSFHFFTESANVPNGPAISDIDLEPIIERVFNKPPIAISLRAAPMAVKPLPISDQDISPNFLSALANFSSP